MLSRSPYSKKIQSSSPFAYLFTSRNIAGSRCLRKCTFSNVYPQRARISVLLDLVQPVCWNSREERKQSLNHWRRRLAWFQKLGVYFYITHSRLVLYMIRHLTGRKGLEIKESLANMHSRRTKISAIQSCSYSTPLERCSSLPLLSAT